MAGAEDRASTSSASRASPQSASRYTGTAIVRGFDGSSTSSISRHRASVDPTGAPYPIDNNGPRRRLSVAERIGSLGNAGGVNSFNKFAASWQRAAGFKEITPRRGSFSSLAATDAEQDESQDSVPDLEQGGQPSRTSLLKAAFERDRTDMETPFFEEDEPPESVDDASAKLTSYQPRKQRLPGRSDDNVFSGESHLSASLGASHGSRYGSISQLLGGSAPAVGTSRLSSGGPPQSLGAPQPDKERQPLLSSRKASEDTRRFSVIPGESTLPQTVFNAVNVLVGVGMLSLPLGILYSGWLIGMGFFLFSAIATSYTAKLLAKCLDVDASLVTFADIAYGSFGSRARVAVSLLFTLELLAACVALVILFADSINLLLPALSVTKWKIVCGGILIPLSFIPLRFLSFSSILGIICCIVIIIAIFVDGFIKPHAFGSLLDPAPTFLFPKDWRTIPLAFGLLMAPWGGHSVLPNIYRDMRHPDKFNKAVNITYIFTYIVEVALTVAGYLMFGETVRDEITANIFITKGYPRWLSMLIIISITIVPLTKIPLSSRPIISTIEILGGFDERTVITKNRAAGSTKRTPNALQRLSQLTVRGLTPVVLAFLAILVPSFDRVMSLLGSAACFTICIVLPCAFHLKIFSKELSLKRKILDWTLLVLCSLLAIIGTVCSFLPKNMLGADPKAF